MSICLSLETKKKLLIIHRMITFTACPLFAAKKKCPLMRAFFKTFHSYFLAWSIQSLATRAKLDLSDTDWKALIASGFLPRFKLATPRRT